MAKTILIVDDSSSLRTVVKIALNRAGYDVLEAGDGKEALAQLDKAGKVNLIVSDVNMPNMDGITFVTEVKKHPRHRFTPVPAGAGPGAPPARAAGCRPASRQMSRGIVWSAIICAARGCTVRSMNVRTDARNASWSSV